MKTLGLLEARYADDHVPLALVLGALGTLGVVRRVLSAAPVDRAASIPGEGSPPEPFVALLLGAIATHDRLLELLQPRRVVGGDAMTTRWAAPSLDGLLR